MVVFLVLDDVAAEVEDGQGQQVFGNYEQAAEHAAGPTVAIGERVDHLELVMADCHADQGIDPGFPCRKFSQLPSKLRNRSSPAGGV